MDLLGHKCYTIWKMCTTFLVFYVDRIVLFNRHDRQNEELNDADLEVQPQRQESPQVELECPTSSKAQTGPADELQKAPPMIAGNGQVKSLQSLAQDAWCWERGGTATAG
nr:hypothetical protein Iba_chr11dCG8620 [Ipomoea batatas]